MPVTMMQVRDESGDFRDISLPEIDEAIRVYVQSNGNSALVSKRFAMNRTWGIKLMKQAYVVDRMAEISGELVGKKKVAPIEECLAKLTDIMRGSQFKILVSSVKKATKKGDSALVVDAIDRLGKYTPQIEANQLKALNTLLTAQGALDNRRVVKDTEDDLVQEVALALMKSSGSAESIIDALKRHKETDGEAESTETEPNGRGTAPA